MAFDDAKRAADRLRLKGPALYSQGDPHARREQCWSPWCNRFVEDMGDNNRCNTDECNERLRYEAVQRGIMFKVGLAWFGNVDSLLVDPDTIQPSIMTQEILKRRGLDDKPIPMCACGKNLKAPRKNVCSKCYQASKLAEYQERRHNRHKPRKGQRKGSGGMNRIKGLGDVKVK